MARAMANTRVIISCPTIATQGNVKNEKKIGEWRTYTKDGRLNKIIQFEKDTFKLILDI